MALLINKDCITCDACVAACPNEAIAAGAAEHVINPDRCTECVGAFNTPQCVDVCPVDCIAEDPNRRETRDQLQARYHRLHG